MLTVALYGNSVVMSSIGASLRNRPGVCLLLVDSSQPDAAQQLEAPDIDAVIFDLAVTLPDWAVALFKLRPHMLLIGIDLAANKALVLSGQPTRVWTTDDLMQLIEGRTSGGPLSRPDSGWGA